MHGHHDWALVGTIVASAVLSGCEEASPIIMDVAPDVRESASGVPRRDPHPGRPANRWDVLERLKEEACACKDVHCAAAVTAELQRWRTRETGQARALDRAQVQYDPTAWMLAELNDCISMITRGPAPRTPAEGGAGTGIVACDEYLIAAERLQACADPTATRGEAYRWAIDGLRSQYSSASGEARAQTENGCRQAREAVKEAALAVGCGER